MDKNKTMTPLAVPSEKVSTFQKNYSLATHGTNKLFMFAGDQKIEHLNDDFFGEGIPPENNNPEHLFKIAQKGTIGTFATQLGLISRYGMDYKDIPYTVKLNSKTNLIPSSQADPISKTLNSVNDVVEFNKYAKINIIGIGYTIYLGSEHEATMLQEAAKHTFHAHQQGLLSIIWIYPRGKAVHEERSAKIIAGAAGVGACLGADFIKINPPQANSLEEQARLLQQATVSAGRAGIICSGGEKQNTKTLLANIHSYIHTGGARGCAIGRNIHQHTLEKAIQLCDSIATIVYESSSNKKNP